MRFLRWKSAAISNVAEGNEGCVINFTEMSIDLSEENLKSSNLRNEVNVPIYVRLTVN